MKITGNPIKGIIMMAFSLNFFHYVNNHTFHINHESRSQYPHKFSPHKFFKVPSTETFNDTMIFVREESKVQLLFIFKLYQSINRIGTDPQHNSIEFSEPRTGVSDPTSLNCASWSHRLWIEVDDDITISLKLL